MRIEPNLMYVGRADEAIAFYQTAIDAKTVMVMRFDESPDKNHPMPLPPNWGQKVMHCGLMVGNSLVMLSDGMCSDKFGVSWMVGIDGPQG